MHYRNESIFSFEQYSTRLRKAFQTLHDYKQGKCEAEKVDVLLNQINSNDPKIISAMTICRNSHASSFDNACRYMSKEIAVIYPQQQPNAFGRGGRGRGRQRTCTISAVKRKYGKTFCNGVDMTDTTRYFSPKEYNKIGEEGRKFLNNDKKRKEFKEKNSTSSKKKFKEDENRKISAIINGVINASRNESVASPNPSDRNYILPPMPQHGIYARPSTSINRVSTSSGTSATSQITYDHNGNIVTENHP